jgi:hypothetical protein
MIACLIINLVYNPISIKMTYKENIQKKNETYRLKHIGCNSVHFLNYVPWKEKLHESFS